ncbi:MAG TPA: antA/AntB antirepressor family protein [Clostridia bacterium]|nr:antA/AntB antirepressor family protein [Clostridia bacterium]
MNGYHNKKNYEYNWRIIIDNISNQVVSARDLHEFLEVETQFSIWCTRMIDYGFEGNIDYIALSQKRLTAQGNESPFTDLMIALK